MCATVTHIFLEAQSVINISYFFFILVFITVTCVYGKIIFLRQAKCWFWHRPPCMRANTVRWGQRSPSESRSMADIATMMEFAREWIKIKGYMSLTSSVYYVSLNGFKRQSPVEPVHRVTTQRVPVQGGTTQWWTNITGQPSFPGAVLKLAAICNN